MKGIDRATLAERRLGEHRKEETNMRLNPARPGEDGLARVGILRGVLGEPHADDVGCLEFRGDVQMSGIRWQRERMADQMTTCARCEDEYNLRDGEEPSKYCDSCAQERVVELEELVTRISHWTCECTGVQQVVGDYCAPCLCRRAMKGLSATPLDPIADDQEVPDPPEPRLPREGE